jgi:predicted nucleic acid-binding protein
MKRTAVASRFFLDTNVLLYLVDEGANRARFAKPLVRRGAVISVQVLNEFVNVARKKFKLKASEIADILAPIRVECDVVPVGLETHELAWRIFCTTNLGIYDANIVAAAELADCDVLYSEDMNHNQLIGRVRIANPFIEA